MPEKRSRALSPGAPSGGLPCAHRLLTVSERSIQMSPGPPAATAAWRDRVCRALEQEALGLPFLPSWLAAGA